MAIPDYQSIMLPLLNEVSDGEEYKFRELIEKLSEKFGLTEEERRELLPSGQQPIFDNRVGWAKTYLKKAGLLNSPKRAIVKISNRGTSVLQQNPEKIDVKFLKQFEEFIEFQSPTKEKEQDFSEQVEENSDGTPEELLETAHLKIRKSLAQEILNKVLEMSPTFFERLVVELLVKMGYGGSLRDAGQATKQSSDEGIDGTIKEDKLGLDIIYIQAKRWQSGNVVGRPEIQKFVGALAGQGAKKGIFITTSTFTKEAKKFIPRNETKIVLIDGEQLSNLMIDHNLGVTVQTIYELKKMDSDYFEDN